MWIVNAWTSERTNEWMNNEPGNVWTFARASILVISMVWLADFIDASTITLYIEIALYNDSPYQFAPYCSSIVLYSIHSSVSPNKTRKTFFTRIYCTFIVVDQIKYFICFSYWTTYENFAIRPLNSVWLLGDWIAGWLVGQHPQSKYKPRNKLL